MRSELQTILGRIKRLRLVAIAVLMSVAIACQQTAPTHKPMPDPQIAPIPTTTVALPQNNHQSPKLSQSSVSNEARSPISHDALVDIQTVNAKILLDIRYATTNNFMGRKLYSVSRCVLRYATAKALAQVQLDLERQNLGLKVYDCYRPLSVQRQMWQVLPDDRYVANPAQGSRHNRGAAVDVTLVDRSGRELEMPTGFDDFTAQAHRDNTTASPRAQQHSRLLEAAMTKHGFIPLATEWWHFDGAGWQNFPIADTAL